MDYWSNLELSIYIGTLLGTTVLFLMYLIRGFLIFRYRQKAISFILKNYNKLNVSRCVNKYLTGDNSFKEQVCMINKWTYKQYFKELHDDTK